LISSTLKGGALFKEFPENDRDIELEQNGRYPTQEPMQNMQENQRKRGNVE